MREAAGSTDMKLFDGAACNAAVKKIASGDMTALSVLYEKTGRQVYSLAYSILGREGEADEVMQETFIKIMDCANTYDEKRGNARSWVLAIGRNVAMNRLKRRRLSDYDELSESVGARDDFAGVENSDEVSRLLALLNSSERQIVVLRAVERLKFNDIGGIVGQSGDAVRMKYARALEKLRGYYGKGESHESTQKNKKEI